MTPHIDQHNTRPRLHDCLATTVAAPRTFLDAFTDSLRREKRMYCIQTSAAWSEGRSAMGPPAGARAGSSAPGLAARASWACRRARGLTSSCLTMSSYTWGKAQHSTARYVTTPARHCTAQLTTACCRPATMDVRGLHSFLNLCDQSSSGSSGTGSMAAVTQEVTGEKQRLCSRRVLSPNDSRKAWM